MVFKTLVNGFNQGLNKSYKIRFQWYKMLGFSVYGLAFAI